MSNNYNFEYGFCIGRLNGKRIVCHLMDIQREAWAAVGNSEGYSSVYAFSDEFIDEIEATGDAKDYRGACKPLYFWFDIDNKNDRLQEAFDDAAKLVDTLVGFGLKKENVQIFFSGQKGLHLFFDARAFGDITPSENVPKICRRLAETIAAEAGVVIDSKVYHHLAMLRLPNTLHPKTLPNNLHKIPITYGELTEPDAVEKVTTRAKGMRTLFDTSTGGTPDADAVLYTPVTEPVAALAELWQSVATEVEAKNAQTPQSTDLVPTMISYKNLSEHEKNRVLAYLAAMPLSIQGKGGDDAMFDAVCVLVQKFGINPEEAVEIIIEHYNPRCDPPWKEKDIRYKAEWAAQHPHPSGNPHGFLWDGDEYSPDDAWGDEPTDDDEWKWTNRRDPATFEPFPLDCLPAPMRRYVEEKARSLNQYPASLAMCLLTEAGAHAGATVRLRLLNDWLVPPIIWFCTVGLSGSGKSPALAAGSKLVRAADKFFRQKYEKQMQEYRMMEKASKSTKNGGENMEQVLDGPPLEPRLRMSSITNATIEGLQQYVQAYPRGALIKKDELSGFFGDMTRNSRDGESGEWLSGHNGMNVNTVRKTAAQISTPEAYWSVLGGVTPEVFRTQFKKANRTDDGTLSRFCLLFQPDMREFSREDVSAEAIQRMEVIMLTLLGMDFVDEEQHKPREFSLDAEAKARWEAWGKELRRKSFTTDDNPLTSFYGKGDELLARVALILHLLESVADAPPQDMSNMTDMQSLLELFSEENPALLIPNVISGETMRRAEIITRWIMAETFSCYRMSGFAKSQDVSEKILAIVEECGEPMTCRDIGNKMSSKDRKKDGRERVKQAIDKLVKAGRLHCQTTKLKNGTTVLKYSIPPAQAG